MSKKNLVMLAIMDGYGINNSEYGNAIASAKKPNLDAIFSKYPTTQILASGEAVGLPDGQFGNSEVGHLNIGAGRIVYQSLTRVNIAMREKTLDKMPAIDEAIENAIKKGASVHIMGLMSTGGVHSHIEHIVYLMKAAHDRGVKNVYVHSFLDGSDVPPKSAEEFLKTLQDNFVEGIKAGVVSGRYYAMDRDKNYDRTALAYNALVYGEAEVKGLIEGLLSSYEEGITDEFVKPYLVNADATIKDGDSVIFANFRPDRAIQISLALTNPTETTLTRYQDFQDLTYVSMMLYSEKVKGLVAFDLQVLNNMYGDVISKEGLKQLRIAETEKYAHVTYFFDGGIDKEIEGASRTLVASPKVATYDMQPEMSAYEVTEKVVKAIKSEEFDTIILNFANCDMVGHTAVFDAAVKAVETVDECMGKVLEAVESVKGTLLITADHGNADVIMNPDGSLWSAHTANPVPFCVTNEDVVLHETGTLGDITPTMLELLGINQPVDMTGRSMIKGYKK